MSTPFLEMLITPARKLAPPGVKGPLNTDGEKVPLKAIIGGKVALLVNVASQCGFTSQNAGLQKLQDTYGAKGFTVLAFPSNEFGGQEPGTDEQIEQFVCTKFNGTYPLTKKCCVNGDKAEPVWAYMKHAKPGLLGFEAVKWNYTKVLIDSEGKVIERYAPTTTPETISKDIEKLLK